MKKISYIFIYSLINLGFTLNIDAIDSILTTPVEHCQFIRSSLAKAQSRVIIVSPFITSWRLTNNDFNGNNGLGAHLKAAMDRRVEISVFTDAAFDANKTYAAQGRIILASLGVDLKIVSHLHSKNLIVDNDCITFGSFNWLSADTNPGGMYNNYETTTIMRAEQAQEVIARIVPELINLEVKLHGGGYSSSLLDLSITVEDQAAYALELYLEQYTRPHYKQLAEHILSNYMVDCLDARVGLRILRKAVAIGGANNLIIAGAEALPRYCTRASEFIELAEMLVGINQQQKAAEIAASIFHINRGEAFEELDFICDRLKRIGLREMGKKFEQYILGPHTQ
ncbi:MAG: hypothetical protein FJX03_01965 [Alphaproteobacteria bacterium]|nr:hypothetical protein [Alphaproteobacteria bacterium]